MTINIEHPLALIKLGQLEGQDWVAEQHTQKGEEMYGFVHVLRCWRDRSDSAVIYGAGGIARYRVNPHGHIFLLGSTVTADKAKQADELGFTVTHYDRDAALHNKQDQLAYEARRRVDLTQLVDAVIMDTAIAMGIQPYDAQNKLAACGADRLRGIKAVIAARITGWVNHRLGIIDAASMSELAVAARRQSEGDGFVAVTGDCQVEPKS